MYREREFSLLRIFLNILLFIPTVILGTIIIVAGDFKNHRLGYIVMFFFLGIVIFGFIMGYLAGPSSPAPWEY